MRSQALSYRLCPGDVAGRSLGRFVLLVSAAAALDALLGLMVPVLSPQVSLVAAVLAVLALVAEGRL